MYLYRRLQLRVHLQLPPSQQMELWVVVLALALSVEPVELRLVAAPAAVLSSKMIDLLMESESPDGVVTADSVGGVTRVDCTGGTAWI